MGHSIHHINFTLKILFAKLIEYVKSDCTTKLDDIFW